MDGVLGMALSPYHHGRDRFLYFHSLASTTENVVNTKILRNNSYMHDPTIDPDAIYVSKCLYIFVFNKMSLIFFITVINFVSKCLFG